MADTSAFDELANVIEILDSMGVPVVADTHVHEQEVQGEQRIVADLTIVLDNEDARSEGTEIAGMSVNELNRAIGRNSR